MWAMEEFAGAKLGDQRLTQRLIKLATRFADKPTASIPGACPDWAETQCVKTLWQGFQHVWDFVEGVE